MPVASASGPLTTSRALLTLVLRERSSLRPATTAAGLTRTWGCPAAASARMVLFATHVVPVSHTFSAASRTVQGLSATFTNGGVLESSVRHRLRVLLSAGGELLRPPLFLLTYFTP